MPYTDTTDSLVPQNTNVSRVLYIESPAAGDSFPIAYVPDEATLIAVRAITDAGTVDFNLELRSKLTPDVAGTVVWSADKQAIAAGLEQTGFDIAVIGADSWLHYSASAVSGAGKLWVSVEYSVD